MDFLPSSDHLVLSSEPNPPPFDIVMDDDETSISDEDYLEQSSFEKQKASLQTYLKSLPYDCESPEEMHLALERIVGKVYICAKARNWLVLTTWDGLLQCWLLMRYPMPTTTRAKLVRTYYELTVLPGIEPRLTRGWADMVTRLLANKPGHKPKLQAADLQLPWKPLWRILKKELFVKERLLEPSRNIHNILLYLAEQCRRYFPPGEIPEMLETFLPLVTPEHVLVVISVTLSFLPPADIHQYVSPLMAIWRSFNSSVLDDRFIDFFAAISEDQLSPEPKVIDNGTVIYQDVGIWSESNWLFLVSKALSSMNVPIGTNNSTTATSTANHADALFDKYSHRVKKTINRFHALAKIFVFAIFEDSEDVDGPYGGSKALDSLGRLITTIESFFHPSNSGPWTPAITSFLQSLATDFCKRVMGEEDPKCKIPVDRRITPRIRTAFMRIIRTPALLAMFSKDPISMGQAGYCLKIMSHLEPGMVLPELIDRAYNGLEVVNETHRTTGVLSTLLGISRPLVTENIWLGGQKHIAPLLELCLPGIDLNDPAKTIATTMFITGVALHIRFGDLSLQESGLPPAEDTGDDVIMEGVASLNDPASDIPVLSRREERDLVRQSTAGFADWITSLFRRVLALYENLPEEGGRRNTTGGKAEETVLKSIQSMLDVVCAHLSDDLFDLVLKLVYEYGTTNTKSNAVKAFGQLVSSLARARPHQTCDKFLPFSIAQVAEEVQHGASSIRTTSSHTTIPSDTTLHWHLSIIRGCLGHDGTAMLKHKKPIVDMLAFLVDRAKNERGYSSVGRLITSIMSSLSGTYPVSNRFVNDSEWLDPAFERDHHIYWGKLYKVHEVEIHWHVPSEAEIDLIMEVLEKITAPTLDRIEALLKSTGTWDNVSRNDFCRFLLVVRSVWAGLPTLMLEGDKTVTNPCLDDETELPELLVSRLDVKAGFTLTDAHDSRYQKVLNLRNRFGSVVKLAASALRQTTGDEDHIDAIISVSKAIEVFLLEYGIKKSALDVMRKSHTQTRDMSRLFPRQEENSRLSWVKRAQVYHASRLHMQALYRRRSAMDDGLLEELGAMALSSYTRLRRHAQAVLRSAFGYYVRSTKFSLPGIFEALTVGNDPDRMKGALYLMWDKGIASYALADRTFNTKYFTSLLECQHEEKPSIQQLVNTVAQDCVGHLHEEAVHTDGYVLPVERLDHALTELELEFSPKLVDQTVLLQAQKLFPLRAKRREMAHAQTISSIIQIIQRPNTHWRYILMATRFILGLLRRDAPVSEALTSFLSHQTTSPQPSIRITAMRAITKILAYVKIRSFSPNAEALWMGEWMNPLRIAVPVNSSSNVLYELMNPKSDEIFYLDKLETGFITWTKTLTLCRPATGQEAPFKWVSDSHPSLEILRGSITAPDYLPALSALWSQESEKSGGNSMDLRREHSSFIQSLAQMFDSDLLTPLLPLMDALITDSDKFKQRAGGEILAGLHRGSKHWPKSLSDRLLKWVMERTDKIFAQIKPDTSTFWDSVFTTILQDRDPRRHQPIVDWVLGLSLDLRGDSAFEMSKSILLVSNLVENTGSLLNGATTKYIDIVFENANSNYQEVTMNLVQLLTAIQWNQWLPGFPSTDAFLRACQESADPLGTSQATLGSRVDSILEHLAKTRSERLPPPRVSQSEYDRVSLTMLLWLWVMAHSSKAAFLFPYGAILMPELLRMTELNDNTQLQSYSAAVLYAFSAVTPDPRWIPVILNNFIEAIVSSNSWRLRVHAMPTMIVFFFRNLLSIPKGSVKRIMDVLVDCLADENVEVREKASKMLSAVVRCSQRQDIIPLRDRFMALIARTTLPSRKDPAYAGRLRSLHSAVLGLCALIESFPYSVEPWMPPLTEILARHATDPAPISTTIRKCASEFKKTHQDTWHRDQLAFDEEQLQCLSTMLVGTSYYA